ncbi:MAG TPA: hypothetical protein VLZ12_12080 [Verrucomicrobiae bacterium]|nr:hypothetical protein [Verrucomicrobiae bacterium]
MNRILKNLRKLRASAVFLKWRVRQRMGATLVEYVFIVTIVSIAGVVFLAAIGQTTHNYLDLINSNMP